MEMIDDAVTFQTKPVLPIKLKVKGVTDIARLRICVEGAVDTSTSINKNGVNGKQHFVAFFKDNVCFFCILFITS